VSAGNCPKTITCYSGTRVKSKTLRNRPPLRNAPPFRKSITCEMGELRDEMSKTRHKVASSPSLHTAKSILRHPFALASGCMSRWRASSHVMPRDGHVVILACSIAHRRYATPPTRSLTTSLPSLGAANLLEMGQHVLDILFAWTSRIG
jgi:hypothetical protein